MKLSEHFDDSEVKCRCCGKMPPDGLPDGLLDKLEELRAAVGKPLVCFSWYRCPEHNKKVGGAPKSQHMSGKAVDLSAAAIGVDNLAAAAEKVGFDGIGKYYKQNFVHVDVRGYKARWIEGG